MKQPLTADEVRIFCKRAQQNARAFQHIWESLRTCDNYGHFEEPIHGLDFACIARACGLGMVHCVMDDTENLRWFHYEQCTVLVIILAVCLLVVDILDVFFLVYGMEVPIGWASQRPLYFSHAVHPSKFVPKSLQYVFRKLLVFNYTQLGQRYGPTSRYATHVIDIRQDVLPFCVRGQHHLYNFLSQCQCPCLVGHCIGQ